MDSQLHKIQIPLRLRRMLVEFSRIAVRCKPENIPHFAEKYFKALFTFQAENPNLGFDELLEKFQQSQIPLLSQKANTTKSIPRLKSPELEAGPLLYEARIDRCRPVPRFPAGDSSDGVDKDAKEFTNAQVLPSEGGKVQTGESDQDGIISANVVTLSPGPITPKMALDLAVFRRRTLPKRTPSVQISCNSSPSTERSDRSSVCRRTYSALFEEVPLSDINVDMDAVLIKTSMLPNVSQIIVQSKEVPEIIVFEAEVKVTDSTPEPGCASCQAVPLNEEAVFGEDRVPEVTDQNPVSVTDTTLPEPPAAENAMVTSDRTAESQTTVQSQENLILSLTVPDVQTGSEVSSTRQECAPALAEVKACDSALVSSPTEATEEPKAPVQTDVPDVPGSARLKTELSGAEGNQFTRLMSPVAANCGVQVDKSPDLANSITAVEGWAPYLVYLPLPAVEVFVPGMTTQAGAEDEVTKASSYICMPVATRELPHSPNLVAATTPHLLTTGNFTGTFSQFQKSQNSTQPARPASHGHIGFSKVQPHSTHYLAGVSMAAEGAAPKAHTSASLQQQAGEAVTTNGQQSSISSCSLEKLRSKSSEPTVASVCTCIGPTNHWRLCHLTHPGAQRRDQLPCPYQTSASMTHCGLEQIGRIPMYQDWGLYCSHHNMLRARSSSSTLRPDPTTEPTCSCHNQCPSVPHQGCSAECVCSHLVLPAADRRATHCPLLCVTCSVHQEALCHSGGGTCGGACGLTKTTAVPSCPHQSLATEACNDCKTGSNL